MKNISIVLNIVLLIAVVVLYILHFSGKQTTTPSKAAEEGIGSTNLTVAYVNSDSLVKNFALYEEMRKSFEEKKNRMEKDFASKARSLEGEITSFQKNAQMMTPGEIKAREENLMMKRQSLMQYQENISQQLMQEEMQLNDSLYNKITTYIRGYSKDNNYDMVFGYSRGAGILYAHDSLEITKKVLKGLNEQTPKK